MKCFSLLYFLNAKIRFFRRHFDFACLVTYTQILQNFDLWIDFCQWQRKKWKWTRRSFFCLLLIGFKDFRILFQKIISIQKCVYCFQCHWNIGTFSMVNSKIHWVKRSIFCHIKQKKIVNKILIVCYRAKTFSLQYTNCGSPKNFHVSFNNFFLFERTQIPRIWIRILCVAATLPFQYAYPKNVSFFDVSARIKSWFTSRVYDFFFYHWIECFFSLCSATRFMISLKGHLNKGAYYSSQ